LFTINDKELPANASARLIARGEKTNEIYATNDLDEEQDFAPVIDALPGDAGDAFNPLWRQILIHFNAGVTPRQLFPKTRSLTPSSPATSRWRKRTRCTAVPSSAGSRRPRRKHPFAPCPRPLPLLARGARASGAGRTGFTSRSAVAGDEQRQALKAPLVTPVMNGLVA
jgi:hypothetical protein